MAAQTPWLLVLALHFVLLLHGIVKIQAFSNTYKTAYHFQPPKNWMNDPNGPLVYKNLYHLFYQYNPKGPDWGNIVWAHSTSKDLVNWTPHPAAIFPTQKGDINGCWSGSATILPGGKPALLYTGINSKNQEVQNVAFPKNFSDPLLLEWVKPDINPVITPTPLNQIIARQFRDPTTAWLGLDGRWRIIVGNKIGNDGRVILYTSKDFVHWNKVQHPLHRVKDTGMWECPDFYPVSISPFGLDTSKLGGFGIKHVLKVSLNDTKHDTYVIGTYDFVKDVFVPDFGAVQTYEALRYDYGKFYASKTFYDSLKNRRILWGWVNESLSLNEYIKQGWSGIQGIPRIVWLDITKNQLQQWPIPEIETLRQNKVTLPRTLLKGGSLVEVQGVNAAQADVEVYFELSRRLLKKAEKWNPKWSNPQLVCSQKDATNKGGAGPIGLKVLATKDLDEYTAVFFTIFKKQYKYVALLCSDQTRSSLNPKTDKTTYGLLVDVDPFLRPLSLRTLIDHSVIESYGANGKGVITSRVYPTKAIGNATHLYVFNNGHEDVFVSSLNAWTMKKAHIF